MSSSERDVHLADGRTLRVLEEGDPHGYPVFYLHGTPGSRLPYGKQVQDAERRGIRLVAHDRAGYGGSTPKPGRRVGDEAADVAAIADALGLDRFAVYGHSGGGAPTLACAALLPDRVVAASSLAGLAPYPAEGLDWLAGMGELNVTDFELMMRNPAAWELKTAEDAETMANANPERTAEFLSSLLSSADRRGLTEDVAVFFQRQAKEGYKAGIAGARDDSLATVQPWGFELSAIHVPLQLWHGKLDKFVPFSHGEWLAAHLPGAEVHFEPGEGHITLLDRYPAVHDWLTQHF